MPIISKPPVVDTFFAAYPNSVGAYFDEDGTNVYLDHFINKALLKAKQDVKKLYKVEKDQPSTFVRVYPQSFIYTVTFNDLDTDIALVSVDGETAVPLTQDATGIASAFDDVLQAAGILASPTEVLPLGGNMYEIRVITSDDTEMQITDQDEVTVLLTQNFL